MEENQILESFESGEAYIKAAVMKHPREVGVVTTTSNKFAIDSFIVSDAVSSEQSKPALAYTTEITNQNFNEFFRIVYKARDTDSEDYATRELWKTKSIIPIWNIDYSNLPEALDKIARIKNCRADVRFNPNTGMQTIYIYSPKKATAKSKGQPHIIKNFEHLLKPPTVSGRLIQFTLLLEPTIYPRETIELRIDTSFGNKYKNFSFNADYGGQLGNWSSAFAGANFIGMSNVQRQNNKVKAIEEKGNIFNKQYQSLFIIHRGSTHTPEWSTQVDCSCTEED